MSLVSLSCTMTGRRPLRFSKSMSLSALVSIRICAFDSGMDRNKSSAFVSQCSDKCGICCLFFLLDQLLHSAHNELGVSDSNLFLFPVHSLVIWSIVVD